MNIIELANKNATEKEVAEIALTMLEEQGCRAIDPDDACVYRNIDGNHCAVGLLLPADSPDKIWDWPGSAVTLIDVAKRNPATRRLGKALEKYEILLGYLQQIHDCDLTKTPKDALEYMTDIGIDRQWIEDIREKING